MFSRIEPLPRPGLRLPGTLRWHRLGSSEVRRIRLLDHRDKIRNQHKKLGPEPYGCLLPTLMDGIATHAAKAKGASNVTPSIAA